MNKSKKLKIALDGPSGAGKSTLAKNLAKELGLVYVDTGALYRTVGLYVKRAGTDPHDAEAVIKLLPGIKIEMTYVEGKQTVLLDGEDVGDLIRTGDISMYASAVSAIPAVRQFLFKTQRDICDKGGVVMDGRDIGTVIMPDADVKIFIVASAEARAQRRYDELIAKGENCTYESVLADMKKRDENDRERDVAPAVAASDAVLLDNSGFEPEDSLKAALEIIEGKTGDKTPKGSDLD